MRYNPDTNRYRNVNARALGHLLNSDAPIDCCSDNRGNGNSCGGACGTRDMHDMHTHGIKGEFGGARLASACGCEPSLAMVYPPYQHFRDIYSSYEALCHGTLFRELNKPWKAGGCFK